MRTRSQVPKDPVAGVFVSPSILALRLMTSPPHTHARGTPERTQVPSERARLEGEPFCTRPQIHRIDLDTLSQRTELRGQIVGHLLAATAPWPPRSGNHGQRNTQ